MSDLEDGLTSEPAAPDAPSDWRLDAARLWTVPPVWKLALAWLLAAAMVMGGLILGSGPRSFLHEFTSRDPHLFAVVSGACLLGIGLVSLIIAGVIAGVMKYLFLPFFGTLARAFFWVAPVLGLAVLGVGYLDRDSGIPWLNALSAPSEAPLLPATVQWAPDSGRPERVVSVTPQVTLPPTEDDAKKLREFFSIWQKEVFGARVSCERALERANVRTLMVPSRLSKDKDGTESAAMIATARRVQKTKRETVVALYDGLIDRIKALNLSPTYLPAALQDSRAARDLLMPAFNEACDLDDTLLDQAEKAIQFLNERRLVWRVADNGALVFEIDDDLRAFSQMREDVKKLRRRQDALEAEMKDKVLRTSEASHSGK